jgi:translation initiation factor 6
MGKTVALEIYGSPNVGLFVYVTNEYCLLGKGLDEQVKKDCERAFEVPVHEITIANSQQIGAFIVGNSKGIVIPETVTKSELEALDALKITYTVVPSKYTAFGNNIVVNDAFMFHIPEMEEPALHTIRKALAVPAESLEIDGWDVVGSIVVINSKGGLIQKDIPEEIQGHIEDKLQLSFEPGTINFGSHVIGGGVAVNDKGMIVGKASAGVEIANAELAFGFLER